MSDGIIIVRGAFVFTAGGEDVYTESVTDMKVYPHTHRATQAGQLHHGSGCS